MRTSHRILLRLLHDPGYDFSLVSVWYVNRGAPGDQSMVTSEQIHSLERDYLEISTEREPAQIPYHRIIRILYADVVVWDREHGGLI